MTNGSNGWPDAIAYLTGLSTPQFMLSGLDASLHLAEECLEAERIVPRAVMVTVCIGFLTAFPFAVSAVYSCKDVAETLDSKTGYGNPNPTHTPTGKLTKKLPHLHHLDASNQHPHRRHNLHGLPLHHLLRGNQCRAPNCLADDLVVCARRRPLRLAMVGRRA